MVTVYDGHRVRRLMRGDCAVRCRGLCTLDRPYKEVVYSRIRLCQGIMECKLVLLKSYNAPQSNASQSIYMGTTLPGLLLTVPYSSYRSEEPSPKHAICFRMRTVPARWGTLRPRALQGSEG
jgi:hypothetical protein